MIKNILKYIVIKIIRLEAKLTLLRYRPKIIAISGTVGKTTTKDMVFQAASSELKVRKTQKSLNSEIGIPLTILNQKTGWTNFFSWLKIILIGAKNIIYTKNYPKWLVIETGVDRPGDMDRQAKFLKPYIVIITAFGKVPAHVEYFESPEDVMKEEAKLMNHINPQGALILNADDPDVLKLKSKSKVKTFTFGIENQEADITASNSDIIYPGPTGISFKINDEGNVIPIIIKGVLGNQYIYPALISMLVGKFLGISQTTIASQINRYKASPGRMNIIKGKNDSIILDDTYNSSPIALQNAISVLANLKCDGNKIAILGDMLEIGRFSHKEHLHAGELVAKNKIDYLVTVGIRAEEIGKSANEFGLKKKRIFILKDFKEATEIIKNLIEEKPNNLILVKASQGIRLEKVVKEIMQEPQKADELLVRQEKEWLDR